MLQSLKYVAGHQALHSWPHFGVMQILCIYLLLIQMSKYFNFLFLIKKQSKCFNFLLLIKKKSAHSELLRDQQTHSCLFFPNHCRPSPTKDSSCIFRNNKSVSLCSYTQINVTHYFLLFPKIKSRFLFPSCLT